MPWQPGASRDGVLDGVRILEVAEHTFVPAASALLSDWGADVIKIEHVQRGDAMRGLASSGIANISADVNVLFEHSNRGKRSLGLDLTTPEGLDILYRLAATADVFLTNKLPNVRTKLKIDVDDIRAHNSRIIYTRGTGQGERGPDADRGSYDALAFWARAGIAMGANRPEYDLIPAPPAPGFGDSIGAMTIAGGIMGALFHRERTGKATVVDVSLLGAGLWAMGQAVALSSALGVPWTAPPADQAGSNPLSRNYETKDGRILAFTCLQAGRYWPTLCDAVGRPDLAADPRFSDHASLLANSSDAIAMLRRGVRLGHARRVASAPRSASTGSGRWSRTRSRRSSIRRPSPTATSRSARRRMVMPFKLVAPPVQFDEQPAKPRRAPEFNEHGDAILAELGLDWDTVVDLKIRNVVA